VDEELRLRKAGIDDAEALSEIARAAYEMYVTRIGREPAPMGADYETLIATSRVWLIERAHNPIGLLVTRPTRDHLLIENIAVIPAEQGHGIGSQLLDRAELDAAEAGLKELRLYTNEAMTENLTYYSHHGFIETHRATQDGYRRVFFRRSLP
jgi:N-acetylglutamate synthase-like GNAT family acetyltransferase